MRTFTKKKTELRQIPREEYSIDLKHSVNKTKHVSQKYSAVHLLYIFALQNFIQWHEAYSSKQTPLAIYLIKRDLNRTQGKCDVPSYFCEFFKSNDLFIQFLIIRHHLQSSLHYTSLLFHPALAEMSCLVLHQIGGLAHPVVYYSNYFTYREEHCLASLFSHNFHHVLIIMIKTTAKCPCNPSNINV